ncbi:LacI family DNA-binding transcriptional regulator [Curtobacterium sp. L1-20]|uniref:LacI family DNA-binding transcriptional regulator n=1 Tax=Curtobacterium sp. L1-20 TaxID=3138181 RepID=UPI003B51787A
MARVTLADVSRRAGVSRSTASLVVNDSPTIPKSTKDRVRAAMSELGYVYNRQAAQLRNQRSMTVGLLVTEVRNQYFGELVMALEEAVYEAGYTLLVCYSRDDVTHQQAQLSRLLERGVDGLVVLPAAETTAEQINDLLGAAAHIPCVFFARHFGVDHDYVGADNRRAGELLGRHIAAIGARTVALVGGPRATSAGMERLEGFRTGIAGTAVRIEPSERIASLTNVAGGSAATAALLDGGDLPDAIVAYSDVVAAGTYAELHSRGLRPGEDIAVAAFDDIPGSDRMIPPLTTVATFPSTIGQRCASLLLDRIAGTPAGGPDVEHVLIEPKLRIRASTVSWRHGR